MKIFKSLINNYFYTVIFFLSAAYYYALLFIFDVRTDIQLHVRVVSNIVEGKDFPPNFLYFIAVYAASFFQNNYQSLLYGSLIIISFAIAYKFFVTVLLFAEQSGIEKSFDKTRAHLISNVVGFCLITAFCIYLPKELGLTKYLYLGQIPPNVWHNSTTIFLLPFAILLYWYSCKLLERFEMKNLWMVIGLVILNNLIKPSFFLCFAVVFPLTALMRFKFKKEFFLCLIPVALGFVLIILEYIAIYKYGSYGQAGESRIAIEPFSSWKIYTESISVSFLISVAFPLSYLVFYFKKIISQPFLYYAYLLFFTAMIIMVLFVEKGPRETDGNFFWQTIVCNYVLFLVTTTNFTKHLLETRKFNIKDTIIAAIFALHVFSGWIYLAKTLFRGNYG